jgi:hypothetical protein
MVNSASDMMLRAELPVQRPDDAQFLLSRQAGQLFQMKHRKHVEAILDLAAYPREQLTLRLFVSLQTGRVLETSVRGNGVSGPTRTHFPRSPVTYRDHEVHVGRVGPRGAPHRQDGSLR